MTPSGRFGIHYCTLPRRANPDRHIINCGEGRGSPPQGPSGRSERWFVDLREVPRVAPKSVTQDGPVGLFRNQIIIAAPSGHTQMIKVMRQRKVVRRPPQASRAVQKCNQWPRRAISEPIMTCGPVGPYPCTYIASALLVLS